MKIVIAPDSFKENLTSLEVAAALERGIKRVRPRARCIKVPMADGGEGTVQSLVDATGGNIVKKRVMGPLGEPVTARYGILGDGTTAAIEMAEASGLALVPRERTIKSPSDAKRKRLENLYAQVRDIRERKVGYERLGEIWETQQKEHADDWLLSMEIFEILDETGQQNALKQQVMTFLNGRKTLDKDNATLIEWGFRLVTYHKTGLETVAPTR